MSIKQPVPKQIRLPFSVPRPKKSEAPARVCGICRVKDSRYTCPRCNIAYCSLDCFQNESHAQCSEPFYKSTVMSEIAANPEAGTDEKRKMLEMLRRFEEAQADGESGEIGLLGSEDGSEDEWDELAERLADVDLDNIDTNQLFHLLPPKHRDAFLGALRNPESEETRTLLELAAAEGNADTLNNIPYTPNVLPWWESSTLSVPEDQATSESEDNDDDGSDDGLLDYALEPEAIPADVLGAITPPEGIGRKLAYNAIALAVAYVHTLLTFRLPSLSSTYIAEANLDISELREYIGRLVPFLVDAKSTTRYETLGDAWGSVWERIGVEAGDNPPSTSTLLHLLPLLKSFLHPPILTSSQPKLFPLLADLYDLFTTPKANTTVAVSKKLAFYSRALEQLDRVDWLGLENQLDKEVDLLEQQQQQQDDEQPAERERLRVV